MSTEPKMLIPLHPIYLSTEETEAHCFFRGQALTADDYRALLAARDSWLYDEDPEDQSNLNRDLDEYTALAVAAEGFRAGVTLNAGREVTAESAILRLVPALETLGMDATKVKVAHDECLSEARKYLRALIAVEFVDGLLRDDDIRMIRDLAEPETAHETAHDTRNHE